MPGLIRRYGFAAVVAAVLALMAVVILVKSILPGDGPEPAQAAQGAQPGKAKGPGGPGGPGAAATVAVAPIERHTFSDAIQALGTAQARESIVITPKVSDVIRAIRFDSGDRVRRGQVLVELSNVEQQADLAEAVAANAAAQEEYRRFNELFQRGFAPRARLDAARAAAGAAQSRVDAGRSRMNDRMIRAPFAGVMGLRTASPGQLVQPGTAIGTLDDISQIKLDFDIPESRIAQVRPGVTIVARTSAFPNEEFEGRIADTDSRVSTDTRTLRIRALLPNPGERIRPGMLMTVEIRSNPREVLATPESAVVDDVTGAFVFVVSPGQGGAHIAERRSVRTGQRTGGLIEILDGVTDGEQVVVEGVQRVQPGAAIRVGAAAPADGVRGAQSTRAASGPG